MSNSNIELVSVDRFATRDFVVATELVGRAHEFQVDGGQVKIELPSANNLPKEITDESIRKSFDSILTIVQHKKEKDHLIYVIR